MILLTLILSSGVCLADNYVGGIPLASVQSGTVDGGVYVDSYYGTGDQATTVGEKTIDKTFTIPDDAEIEWAMLLTTVYCGHMQNNYEGTANVSFNGEPLGSETLNVSFTYAFNGGDGYVQVNDHVNRVTSDYMMYYDVTNLVKAGENTAVVNTVPSDGKFDGRVKLITLVVAYNDGSGNEIWYQVNRGHDADTYYSDDYLEDYVGSTTFQAALPEDVSLTDAELTVVHMASTDGTYTFNGNAIPNGTPQGTYCGLDTWNVTDSFNSAGASTLTYDRSAGFYKCALGILTAEYTKSSSDDTGDDTSDDTSGETSSADLAVETIKVTHNGALKAWDNLNNTVNVTVINNGPEDAGSFALELYSDSSLLESKQVTGLANGATETVGFVWKPDEVKDYTLKAVVVPGTTISDTDETNNELSKTQTVLHNGYVGDNPLETYAHDTVKGGIIYDYGNSSYSNKITPGDTYTVGHSLELPEGATVKFARLYNYWTWSATGTTGITPSMSLEFDGNSLTPEAEYSDQKGWGSQYDYPTGTWAYDVTELVSGSGTYTTTVTNINSDSSNYFCVDGIALLVVYEDSSGEEIEYWVNEGCDMVSTMSTSGGLIPEEATVEIPFEGSINLSNVDEATLWTTVQSGGHDGISLEFNEMSTSGVYDSTPYSDLDVDEERSVGTYLQAENNIARIVPPLVTDNSGDYLSPSSAILVVTYKDETPVTPVTPALSLSASTLNLTVGEETEVTYIVLSSGTSVEGALVNLSGCATGSGTTDANGTAVLAVNASCEGTITAVASKDGYTGAELTQQAVAESDTPVTPALSLSASPLNLTVGEETEVTYTVTSSGTSVEGALVNLSGCATGSGTTDANGTAVLAVNASCEGTITAVASKDGYTGAELTQQAIEASSSGASSSATVSLKVDIIPVVSLTVSTNSIDFGTVTPGTPSESMPLTLKNNGGTCINVIAEVDDQENGPFETGLLLDQSVWSSYSKCIAAESSETSEAQLDLPLNYASTGQFQGSLIFWAEAA